MQASYAVAMWPFLTMCGQGADNAKEEGGFVDEFVENETQRAILRLLMARPISARRIAEEVGMPSHCSFLGSSFLEDALDLRRGSLGSNGKSCRAIFMLRVSSGLEKSTSHIFSIVSIL